MVEAVAMKHCPVGGSWFLGTQIQHVLTFGSLDRGTVRVISCHVNTLGDFQGSSQYGWTCNAKSDLAFQV